MNLYGVFDHALGEYAEFHCFPTETAAVRAFAGRCQDPQTLWHRAAKDYALFQLAKIDPKLGLVTAVTPVMVTSALFAMTLDLQGKMADEPDQAEPTDDYLAAVSE